MASQRAWGSYIFAGILISAGILANVVGGRYKKKKV